MFGYFIVCLSPLNYKHQEDGNFCLFALTCPKPIVVTRLIFIFELLELK